MTNTSTLSVDIRLAITLLTPACVGAAGSGGGIADKTLLRDGWNRPIIPGSQLKGRVRHACERIAAALGQPICGAPYAEAMCPHTTEIKRLSREPLDLMRGPGARPQCAVCAIFGSALYPSPLMFSDLIFTPATIPTQAIAATRPAHLPPVPLSPVPAAERVRPGIAIDRRRRTVQEEVLYLTETTDAGEVFRGAIRGQWRATPAAEARSLVALLVAGIQQTTRWGGGSSRGLGWASVQLEQLTIDGVDTRAAALLEEVQRL